MSALSRLAPSRLTVAICMASLSWQAAANCGSGFCLVNSHWQSQGAWAEPGMRIDLRHEWIEQGRAWFGDRAATPAQTTFDPGTTINRNTILTLDYSFSPQWGMTLRVPYVDMDNRVQINPAVPQFSERSAYAELGDAELALRRALVSTGQSETGAMLGVKFPTGDTSRQGNALYDGETDLTGPVSPIERAIQPGTGSTDLMLGLYHHRALGARFSAYGQVAWRQPVRWDDVFRPGRRISADMGLSYHGWQPLTLSIQAAFSHRASDPVTTEPSSGNRVVALSPGMSVDIGSNLRAYLFFQKPVYRYTKGLQAVADDAWVSGLSLRF